MKDKIQHLFSGEYSKSILKVFTGSTVAFAISFLIIPVISRIYNPDEYGNFQVMLSLLTALSVVGSLKYETAIVLTANQKERNDLFTLCLILLCGTTIILGVIFFTMGHFILELLDAEVLKPYILYMILLFFFIGLFQITRYNFIAEKKYGQLSINNVINSIIMNGGKVGFGYLKPVFSSLFWGHFAGMAVASVYSFFIVQFSVKTTFSALKNVAVKYRRFFIFEMPGVFLLSLTVKLPIFLIAKYHGSDAAGLYAMAALIIDAPLDLIAKSVKEVFYKSAAEKALSNKADLKTFFTQNIKVLGSIGLLATLFIIFGGEMLIDLVLGKNWEQVGWMIKILILAKIFHFVSNVTASALRIIDSQNLYLLMMSFFFLSRLVFLFLFRDQVTSMIWALAGSTILFYVFYNAVVFNRLHLFKSYD